MTELSSSTPTGYPEVETRIQAEPACSTEALKLISQRSASDFYSRSEVRTVGDNKITFSILSRNSQNAYEAILGAESKLTLPNHQQHSYKTAKCGQLHCCRATSEVLL